MATATPPPTALPGPPASRGGRSLTLRLEARTRAEVLAGVARAAGRPCPRLDAQALEAALAAREAERSTVIADGVACPHAAVEGIDEPLLLDVTLSDPVPWDGRDARPVDRCLVLLVPPGAHGDHLRLVADAVRRLGG